MRTHKRARHSQRMDAADVDTHLHARYARTPPTVKYVKTMVMRTEATISPIIMPYTASIGPCNTSSRGEGGGGFSARGSGGGRRQQRELAPENRRVGSGGHI